MPGVDALLSSELRLEQLVHYHRLEEAQHMHSPRSSAPGTACEPHTLQGQVLGAPGESSGELSSLPREREREEDLPPKKLHHASSHACL